MRFLKTLFAMAFLTVAFLTVSCSEPELPTYSETSFMGIEVVSAEAFEKLETENEPVYIPEGTDLRFSGNPVPYYENECTYLLPVDLDSVEWDDGRLTTNDGGKLYLVADDGLYTEAKADSIASNRSFTLLHVVDGSLNKYTIKFTGLPIMTVTTKEPAEDPSNPIGEDDVDCILTMYEPTSASGTPVYQVSDAYLHERGGSTIDAGYLKKGYRINLRYTNENGEKKNNHLSFCGLRTEDDWIIIPLYTEDTKIREKFCIDTWEMFGLENNDYDMDNGTRMEYIELIVNGTYWGMVGLVEPIDGKQLNMSAGDVLVKIHSWTKPKADILRTLGNTVLYVDYSAALAEQETMDIKYPSDVTQESWDVMATFMEYVYESTPQRMVRDIGSWIDLGNAVDHWLFTNFICAGDNVWKNLYISFKKDGDIYKIHLTPWDFDLTFGEKWDSEQYLHWRHDSGVLDDIYQFEYAKRVIEYTEGGKAACYDRWQELRADVLKEENIMQRVDEIHSFMMSTGAYLRDLERWPEGGHTEDLTFLKEMITLRLEYLDAYIEMVFGPEAR